MLLSFQQVIQPIRDPALVGVTLNDFTLNRALIQLCDTPTRPPCKKGRGRAPAWLAPSLNHNNQEQSAEERQMLASPLFQNTHCSRYFIFS